MNRAADTSMQSNGTQLVDLSLGSFASSLSATPARNARQPSGSTATSSDPIATPSPPAAAQFTRRRLDEGTPISAIRRKNGLLDPDESGSTDVLETPDREKKLEDGPDVTSPGRPTRTRSAGAKGGVNLTLRDQEKVRISFVPLSFRVYALHMDAHEQSSNLPVIIS